MPNKTTKRLFRAGDDSATILCSWWERLEQGKGERAVLRRASSPTEVVFSPAYHHLLDQLQKQEYTISREALASVAGLASHVKGNIGTDKRIAQLMARPRAGGGGAKVSGLRFRRLLAVTERDELYPLLIRVIRLLDGKVNLVSLANSAYWWNEITRKQWAYDYYATAPTEQ